MNRTLNIRIWDKVRREMSDDCERFNIALNGRVIDFYDGEQERAADSYEVMLSTGLKDKTGREIFEGDVIQGVQGYFDHKEEAWKQIKGDIVAHVWYYEFGAEWTASRNHLYSESACALRDIEQRLIIGNIFENPELLSQ